MPAQIPPYPFPAALHTVVTDVDPDDTTPGAGAGQIWINASVDRVFYWNADTKKWRQFINTGGGAGVGFTGVIQVPGAYGPLYLHFQNGLLIRADYNPATDTTVKLAP